MTIEGGIIEKNMKICENIISLNFIKLIGYINPYAFEV